MLLALILLSEFDEDSGLDGEASEQSESIQDGRINLD